MESNPDRVQFIKYSLELALLASTAENIDYVYPYAVFVINWNTSGNEITRRESDYLKNSIQKYYNKLKDFDILARDIDRSLIV